MERIVYGENEKIPGESAYDRCSYAGCKNGKYRNNRKLFLFPRHTDAERLEKWLRNCGNKDLRKKAYSSIRRSGLCGDHFDPSCFSDKTKYFLKRNSVPLPNYPPNLGKNDYQIENNENSGVVLNRELEKLGKVDDDEPTKRMVKYPNFDDYLNNSDEEIIADDPLEIDINNSSLNNISSSTSIVSGFIDASASTSNKIDTIVKTSMSTTELLRRLNANEKNDLKIIQLEKQNSLLRKEIKRLKQLEKRRKLKSNINYNKSTVDVAKLPVEMKNIFLNVINSMDLPSTTKANILLQLFADTDESN